MEIAVRYFSKLGHTKEIAEAIAEAVGVEAKSIVDEPSLDHRVDVLFLGGAPYANIMDDKLRTYAKSLSKDMVGKAVLFTTSNWSQRTANSLRKILSSNGIEVAEGHFYAHMLKIKKGVERAKEFAKNAIKE